MYRDTIIPDAAEFKQPVEIPALLFLQPSPSYKVLMNRCNYAAVLAGIQILG